MAKAAMSIHASIISILFWGCVQAYAIQFQHFPPIVKHGVRQIELSIPAIGIKKARVLIIGSNGLTAKSMTKMGANFIASVDIGSSAVLRYYFQVQEERGTISTSKQYEIRIPASDFLEQKIRNLTNEINLVKTKTRRIKNAMYSLNRTSSSVLKENKSAEMANALITLREKEEALKKCHDKTKATAKKYSSLASKYKKGKKVARIRKISEKEYRALWSKTRNRGRMR